VAHELVVVVEPVLLDPDDRAVVGHADQEIAAPVRILAPEGSEQIMEASLMIKFGLPVSAVARHFHPYLTQSEAVKLAAIGLDQDIKTLSCCAH
jgi:mercuric reductase